MAEFLRLLAYGAACIFVGVAIMVRILGAISRWNGYEDDLGGCFGNFLTTITLLAALSMFILAVVGF